MFNMAYSCKSTVCFYIWNSCNLTKRAYHFILWNKLTFFAQKISFHNVRESNKNQRHIRSFSLTWVLFRPLNIQTSQEVISWIRSLFIKQKDIFRIFKKFILPEEVIHKYKKGIPWFRWLCDKYLPWKYVFQNQTLSFLSFDKILSSKM